MKNIFIAIALLFALTVSGQTEVEVTYVEGLAFKNLTTTQLNNITTKEVGDTYFDVTKGNPVYWTGSDWRDLTGGGLSPGDQTKLNFITVTQNVDLDDIESKANSALQSYTETDPTVTPSSIKTDLETLTGNNRLSASAIRDISANEADPVFSASEAASITSTNKSNWNSAFGWGDWGVGVDQSFIEGLGFTVGATAGADWNTNLINIPADIADGDDDTKNSQAETVAQVSAEYPDLDTDGTDDVNTFGNQSNLSGEKVWSNIHQFNGGISLREFFAYTDSDQPTFPDISSLSLRTPNDYSGIEIHGNAGGNAIDAKIKFFPTPGSTSSGNPNNLISEIFGRVKIGEAVNFDEAVNKGQLDAAIAAAGTGSGTDDQTALEVPFTPNGDISATNVQDAIEEVRNEAGYEILYSGGTVTGLNATLASAGVVPVRLSADVNDVEEPVIVDGGQTLISTGYNYNVLNSFVGDAVIMNKDNDGTDRDINIIGGKINGTVATSAIYDAVRLDSVSRGRIENVIAESVETTASGTATGNFRLIQSDSIVIKDVQAYDTWRIGIYITDGVGNTIEGGYVTRTRDSGIGVVNSPGLIITGGTLVDNCGLSDASNVTVNMIDALVDGLISINASGASNGNGITVGHSGYPADYGKIVNSRFEGNTKGLHFQGAGTSDILVSNNTIVGNATGIRMLSGVEGITVTNNVLGNTADYSIVAGLQDISVYGNKRFGRKNLDITSVAANTNSDLWSESAIRMSRLEQANNSLLSLTMPTSTTNLYGMSINTERLTGGTDFEWSLRAHKNTEAGVKLLTVDDAGNVDIPGALSVNGINIDGSGSGSGTPSTTNYTTLQAISNPQNGDKVEVTGDINAPYIGGIFTYDSTLSGTNNRGTIIAGWVRENKEILKFEYFSAIGDGVADDAQALKAAVDVGGVFVVDPEKTYNITQQVDINNPVTIHFQGAKIISSTSRRMFRVNSSDVHLLDFDIENTVVDATEDLLGLIYGVGVDMNNVTITGKIDGGGQSYINAVKFDATNSKMTNFRFDLECYNIGRMGWEFISHTNDNDDDFKAENIHIERFISDNTGAAGSSGQPISFSGNLKNSSARNIVANDFTDIGIEVASCYSVLVENARLTNPKLASDRFFTSFKNVGYTQNNIIFRDIKTEGTGKIEMSSTGKAVLVDNLTTKDAVRIEGNNAQIINSDIETSLLVQALENDFKISNSKVRFTTGGRFSATTGNFFMENVDAVTDLDGQIFDGGTGQTVTIRNSTFTNGFFNVDADVDLFNFKFNSTASPTRFRGTGTYTYDYVFDNGVKVADTHRAGATGGGDVKSDGTVAMTAPLKVQTIQSTSSDFITQTSSGQRLMRTLDFANAFSDNTTSTFFQMGRNSAIFTANAGAILSRVGYTVQDGVVIGNVAFGSLPAPTAMLDVLGTAKATAFQGNADAMTIADSNNDFTTNTVGAALAELAANGGGLISETERQNLRKSAKNFPVTTSRALTLGDMVFDSGADIGRKKRLLATTEVTLDYDATMAINDAQHFETQDNGVINIPVQANDTIYYDDTFTTTGVSINGNFNLGYLEKKRSNAYYMYSVGVQNYVAGTVNLYQEQSNLNESNTGGTGSIVNDRGATHSAVTEDGFAAILITGDGADNLSGAGLGMDSEVSVWSNGAITTLGDAQSYDVTFDYKMPVTGYTGRFSFWNGSADGGSVGISNTTTWTTQTVTITTRVGGNGASSIMSFIPDNNNATGSMFVKNLRIESVN